MDEDFLAELIQTFILEFEELMHLYQRSLKIIRRHSNLDQAKKDAYADIFRIFHTLKGDSSYFPEYESFTNFTKKFCEVLRPLDDSVYDNPQVLRQIRLNFSRLSSALKALKQGKSLASFNFKNY